MATVRARKAPHRCLKKNAGASKNLWSEPPRKEFSDAVHANLGAQLLRSQLIPWTDANGIPRRDDHLSGEVGGVGQPKDSATLGRQINGNVTGGHEEDMRSDTHMVLVVRPILQW